jgi:hypothetical protein
MFCAEKRMLQPYVLSVSAVSEVRCKCLYIDVAKVDRDVAHVAIVIHVCFKCFVWMLQKSIRMLYIHACCKRMFQLFHVFHTYVANVLSGCYICFAMPPTCFHVFFRCLQVFYMYVTSVLPVLDVCCKCFI